MREARQRPAANLSRPARAFTPARLAAGARRRELTCRAFWRQLLPGGRPKDPAPSGPSEKPLYRPSEMVPLGDLKVSPMGLGTWSWGNRFLWGYDESQDPELQQLFNLVVRSGINLFDTADSYGTGRLNGKSLGL
ncbi:hypothetical protein GPECTOR_106g118 [Gonium pectorale]|uniref:NADP-dependent oxidoreductase domain-containing protein n=1 Tax=Gonium pectorale TaxID=33097 RepID=A0A150FZK5_GONPE|nr:hypothetical protein GPECTOR_106g118 [Gonium pectorale]|eukprot:KXZ43024.1 hypothetical protein GPECTOR_106g118 [Gonium pectorale]